MTNLDELRTFCLSLKGVSEGFPFGEQTLVFKVMSKAFVLTGIDKEMLELNVKADPEQAIEDREKYDFVKPGYHMNKKYWNTIVYNGSNSKYIREAVKTSYQLVVNGLTKKEKEELEKL